MEKLKTLKNIKCRLDRGVFYNKEDLKKEAIKWIKHLDNRAMNFTLITDWIEHFFNITTSMTTPNYPKSIKTK